MGRSNLVERRSSARTPITLAASYGVAAGLHGVLAVRFAALWQAVLAVVLLLAAIGFVILGVRRALPPQRGDDRALQERG